MQLCISPAGGGCFPHSRRILEVLELAAGAAGAAGAADAAAGEGAARLELARGDATAGAERGELNQPLFGEGTGGVAARAAGEAAEEAEAFPGLSADAGAAGAGGTGGAGGATGGAGGAGGAGRAGDAGGAGAVAGGGGAGGGTTISGGSSASWVSPSCSNTSDAATMVRWKGTAPISALGSPTKVSPYCWVAACNRRNSLKEPKDPKMDTLSTGNKI